MFEILLDLLFPRRSLSGSEGSFITEAERKNLRLAPLLLHQKNLRKQGLRYLDSIVAAGRYDHSKHLQKMILTYKYKRVPAFTEELAKKMCEAVNGLLLPLEETVGITPVLCPVPLHWIRENERGFNQAEQLAQCIGAKLALPVEDLLFRTRRTGHQAHRTREDRLTALIGAFSVKPGIVIPRWVVLIDDLSTTGATLEECAKMLKKAGVMQVSGLVAAAG